MSGAISVASGVFELHDARATLEVLEFALRATHMNAYQRHRYLSLAMLCATWRSPRNAIWPAADVPTALVEQVAIRLKTLRLLHGDEDLLHVLGAYSGVVGLTQRDVLHEALLRPQCKFMDHALAAAHPARYLAGAVRRRMAANAREMPKARMMELDGSRMPAVALAAAGIDVEAYAAEIRTTEPALARAIEMWCHGANKAQIGETLYRRMLRHFSQPQARAIGQRSQSSDSERGRAMAPPTWFPTTGRRLDSVWHRQNARLIG